MRKIVAVALLAALFGGQAQATYAQKRRQPSTTQEVQALRKQVLELREGQEALQRELQEIKQLLQQLARAGAPPQPTGAPTSVTLDGDPHLGSDTARVVLIDFSDYQCPFCGRFARETMPQLDKEYISTGKVKYIFRDLPIESIHPHAVKAAMAAGCADEQGKYWAMHYKLFDNQRQLDPLSLTTHAEALGLDAAKFKQCMSSNKYEGEIRADVAAAQAANIEATPSFVIGLVNAENPRDPNVKVLKTITGAQPFQVFKAALDAALAASGAR
jgi:protein-disulfide isomerase